MLEPTAASAAMEAPAPAHPHPLGEFADARILVVDDQPVNVVLLRRVLERAGFTAIASATDARQAMALFDTLGPDLVLLDLHMPHVDGFAVLEQVLRRVAPGGYLPVLVLTADASREARERALAAGAHDFVTKPFDPVEVVQRARNLLQTRRLHLALRAEKEGLETAVRARTAELRAALDAAEAAGRAKGQLLANVSHELRTPLTALRGSLGLLEKAAGDALPPGAARLLDVSVRNTGRLVRGVEDILLLQSLDSGEAGALRAPVDAGALAAEVAEGFRPRAAERGIGLVIDAPDGLAPVATDEARLRDLLARLLDNAVRFTTEGEVRVRVRVEGGVPRAVEVRDTGPGIAPERLAAVFQPFEQADNSDTRAHGGLGLGLAIARATAALLGFRLSAQSAPGAGSTFSLDLRPGRDAGEGA
jgi:two-component system sensor histidine kinase/response regulator